VAACCSSEVDGATGGGHAAEPGELDWFEGEQRLMRRDAFDVGQRHTGRHDHVEAGV
jgi:hypothetical protein